ncbi:PREDICTED: uncharacterized protein LOC109225964 [Nicotiana attenuata]|uniref:uncharacterized protein LOC109225964 n=1 Tax=Nicotiana attenuata TaxID=49451 RepID=UPI000904F967|nr:PREDICTED: uncharacterized protein LOC109225964 [Nicotiana attenuata]
MVYFGQSLSGSALEWYTRQDPSRWYTWDDLAQAFAGQFQYNLEIVPDRLSLIKLEKKPEESFREYGFRCREQAARVDPPMKESDMVDYFLQALEPTYFGHLVTAIGKSFNEVVKMGGMVEEGLNSNKIMSYSAIKATTQAIQSGTGGVLGKKNKEEPLAHTQWRAPASQNTYSAPQNTYPPPRAYRPGSGFRPNRAFRNERVQKQKTFTPLGESYTSIFHRLKQLGMLNPIEPKMPNPLPRNLDHSVSCEYCSGAPGHDTENHRIEVQAPEAPNINQNPLLAHHEANIIELIHKGVEPKKPSQAVMMICSSEAKVNKKAASVKPAIQSKRVGSMPVVVIGKGSTSTVAVKLEPIKVVVQGEADKTVVVVKGAPIEPVIIKPVTQLPVTNSKAIPWNYEQVAVTYKGKEIKEEVCEAQGLTRSGRCFAPKELRKARVPKDNPVLVKKALTEEEAEEFLKKMKVQDYSIVEQLRKTPAQISLLSLLIHSDEHRRALMKILNEAHVPDKISVNHLEKIANKIFEVNRVTFSDDELPVEGTEHNRALYLTIKCEDSVVTRVLVDNGSTANICPLSTLNKLKVNDDRIHKNSICVRGFDGGGTDTVGDIILELTIGPVEFTMEFQVLDVVMSYNLLLGRPWIHAAKAVPSTLHQMVKFEWDRQEIVVHGEDNMCAVSDAIVPFKEVDDDKGPWVYQVFDTVSVEKVPEGKSIPAPRITAATVMVASEILKNGFVPRKGLGVDLQGIVQPVSLPKNLDTFGLGFKPTAADIRRARKMKKRAWVLPKPTPRLSRPFVRPGVGKKLLAKVPGSLIGADGDLGRGLKGYLLK